ncbi:MAG: aminoacyl-histidine dipeptidase [Lachnospiraceae bacterium]|nr:aminoacyl-histidine dipeptidase [Lachnospiraceae bacterium]
MSPKQTNEKSVLGGIAPEAVFSFFEQICAIPHGSGHTEKISAYLTAFAKERGIRYKQDEMGNVILFQDASAGYEDKAPVILQGHMDMVCVAEDGVMIDFEKDGLTLEVHDGLVTAKGTSLGGDDGIAVAMALAILDDPTIPHPPLEVVITVDEEVGMLGAAGIDLSEVKGRRLLNIDSEDEGYLLLGCAGGATVTTTLTGERITDAGKLSGVFELVISSLVGGHSGVEIDKGRANGCVLLGRAAEGLSDTAAKCGAALLCQSLEGGGKDNAIPTAATLRFFLRGKQADTDRVWEQLLEETKRWQEIFKREYAATEPSLVLTLTKTEDAKGRELLPFDEAFTKKLISLLRLVPNGIQSMSRDIPGLVQTSLNLGILKTAENTVSASYLVRSSLESEKREVIGRISALIKLLGGQMDVAGEYPAWEYKQESPLRELMKEVFFEQYNREPVLQTIHAGVECGIFAQKIEDLEAVSFGPDLTDIHSPKEAMDIASVQRTWKYLLEVLRKMQ